jgi:hypothetical protein
MSETKAKSLQYILLLFAYPNPIVFLSIPCSLGNHVTVPASRLHCLAGDTNMLLTTEEVVYAGIHILLIL